jgi:hypothetical protein
VFEILEHKARRKRASGVAQVVECPPRKHEALSSNANTYKKAREIHIYIYIYIYIYGRGDTHIKGRC